MQSVEDLQIQFRSDFKRISKGFIEGFQLKFSSSADDPDEPEFRWADFVLRYIPPQPRTIVKASEFPTILDSGTETALSFLEDLIRKGEDVNSFQSKGLIKWNDTNSPKKRDRTDSLWADWGIHHLHLPGALPTSDEFFSERSDLLLFCLVLEREVALLDIKSHDDDYPFSDDDLFKRLVSNWPDFMESYRLKGILPPSEGFTSEERQLLRRSGISTCVEVGGKVYMGAGMGVSSAATANKVTMALIECRKTLGGLAEWILDPEGQFLSNFDNSLGREPTLSLQVTTQGLSIYEEIEDKSYLFPRSPSGALPGALANLQAILAPWWAVEFCLRKSGNE